MFWGMLISAIGASAIWPFQMIYIRQTLNLPLSRITLLNMINSTMGLLMAFTAGPLADRLGRKWMIVAGLILNGAAYLLLSQASTFSQFALLLGLTGAVNPLYRIGADAMVADLIPSHQRVEAYALMRMIHNAGISIGPAVGGFLAARSYTLVFLWAASGLALFGIMMAAFSKETLPARQGTANPALLREKLGGYQDIFKDAPFISFIILFILAQFCSVLIWVLLGVYVKENYAISEQFYGWIPTTNALMVVTLQIGVTQISRRYKILPVMTAGAALYALAVTSIAWGSRFWHFWTSMVVMTLGEMLLMPTSSTFVANLAPQDKRGRYMSLYGLTWGLAAGIAPLLGGFLNDQFGPKMIWYGGGAAGLISVIGFTALALIRQNGTVTT